MEIFLILFSFFLNFVIGKSGRTSTYKIIKNWTTVIPMSVNSLSVRTIQKLYYVMGIYIKGESRWAGE